MQPLPFTDPVELNDQQILELRDFLKRLAYSAGEVIRPLFRSTLLTENKSDSKYDPVTQADRESEASIRRLVRQHYPSHGIYGEEYGFDVGSSGLTWVIDPIDGTRAFVSGMWHWGTLIALFNGQRAVLGCMYQPVLDELFIGDTRTSHLIRDNQSTRLNSRQVSEISQATLCCTHPDMFTSEAGLQAFRSLAASSRMSRYGGDCYHYALLAMGLVDICVENSLKPYDIQGLIPLVEGAGGILTTWSGKNAAMGGQVLASANADLHERALAILRPAALD